MDRRALVKSTVAWVLADAEHAQAKKGRHTDHARHRCPKPPSGVRTSTAEQPDVVVFLTDDMRADDWPLLQQAQARIGGTWFPQFCYDVALCAPTRATLLTGQMAHHHGILTNDGAARRFVSHEPASLAPAVQSAGYHSAYIGKYMNGYDGKRTPPGWDEWRGMVVKKGQTYQLPCGYATTVVTQSATEALVHAPAAQPLFLFVSHHAPHGPSIPEKQYAKADVGPTRNAEDQDRKRCLLSVDDSIAAVAKAMGTRWDTAIVLALSDNGFMLGEHGRAGGKAIWWDQAERVPLLARLSAASAGTDDRLVSSIDIGPTVLRATGATATWPVDGLALQDAWDRESVLIADYPHPRSAKAPWAGLKGKGWVYVEQQDEPARYYADPAEEQNRIDEIDPTPLHARLMELLE